MPGSEEAVIFTGGEVFARNSATASPVTTELAVGSEQTVDAAINDKFGSPAGFSGPSAPKTSKRFVDEDSKSPEYRSDAWRMANFKVVPCAKRYAHDWTICPFAHPGEKARRRDPRLFSYAGIACPEMKKAGFCNRGDKCPYAHNVFEFWLHPTRYRTQLCNDGRNCTRNVCFFAHTLEEMRPIPVKPSDGRKDAKKGGTVSPDTPFMQSGASIQTTSSTASTEVWGLLSPEDRCKSSGLSPEDFNKGPAAAHSNGLIDELANSLEHVKLAMSGEKRDEVINMLSTLLQEAVQKKAAACQEPASQPQSVAPQGGHNHAAELSLALSALERSQARSLLVDTNRRDIMAKQLANSAPDCSQDWRQIVQQILEGSWDAPSRAGSSRPPSGRNPLFTAPAAVDLGTVHDRGINLASRVLSADLGTQNFWQPNGLPELPVLPRDVHKGQSHMLRCVSGDIDAGPGQLNGLEDGLFSGGKFPLPSANPSALRRQSFSLEDAQQLKPQPRREVRRPPASAFQSAAGQDWKQPVGRAANVDLRWANSGGRLSSNELSTIKEGLPPLMFNPADLHHKPEIGVKQLPFGPSVADRSKSTNLGNYEPGFNLLPAPLSFPTTQPGGRDSSALHSAPYDFAFAYARERELVTQSRPSFDQPSQLQGWAGLTSQDYGARQLAAAAGVHSGTDRASRYPSDDAPYFACHPPASRLHNE